MPNVRVERLSGVAAKAAPRSRSTSAAGAVAGLAAGSAMALYVIAAALLAGQPALLAFRAIAEGTPGLAVDSPGAALAGVLVHAAVSAGLGVAYAGIIPRDFPPACAAGIGVGYALFVMGLFVGFLPAAFVWELHAIGGSWVAAHAIYGVVLGLALAPHPARRGEARR